VRTLCEFAARTGDLDFRYTPRQREEGICRHRRSSQARIGTKAEYPVSGECLGLRCRGRAEVLTRTPELLGRNQKPTVATCRGHSRPSARAAHRLSCESYGALLCRSGKISKQ